MLNKNVFHSVLLTYSKQLRFIKNYKLRLKPERLLFAGLNMGVVPGNGIVEGKDLLPTFSDSVQCKCDARVCTNIFPLHRPSCLLN